MDIQQVKLVYEALAKTGRGRSSSSVAKETGVPVQDVDRLVAFIKKSPLFQFTLTRARLLGNLRIPRFARGTCTQVVEHSGMHRFFTNGNLGKVFAANSDKAVVQQFAAQHQAEAAAAGMLYYLPGLERLDVLAPRVVECLALMPAESI